MEGQRRALEGDQRDLLEFWRGGACTSSHIFNRSSIKTGDSPRCLIYLTFELLQAPVIFVVLQGTTSPCDYSFSADDNSSSIYEFTQGQIYDLLSHTILTYIIVAMIVNDTQITRYTWVASFNDRFDITSAEFHINHQWCVPPCATETSRFVMTVPCSTTSRVS